MSGYNYITTYFFNLIYMIVFIVTFLIVLYFIIIREDTSSYQYRAYLLTIPDAVQRRRVFFNNHDNSRVPVEMVYGDDTRNIANARKYEHVIEPDYFEKAVEMYYDETAQRPTMSHFNVGAIGCYFGHMQILDKAIKDGVKYALIFEDNVVVKSPKLYDEVERVIKERGDTFEACFFHCLSHLPDPTEDEKVLWIASTKCYLVHVPNMKRYLPSFVPMDNHVDLKFEDVIAKGARVYYRDLRKYVRIDRSHKSTIGHRGEEENLFFSRQYPKIPRSQLIKGY